jgi:[acyl-carrier-protein] S-malonyltransferase
MTLGLLCPGQGDQSPAMFGILEGSAPANDIFALFSRETGREPDRLSLSEMQANVIAQPLVCAYQLAAWAVLQDRLPQPRALAGYSVGELAAYGCARALAPGDVIRLAQDRARKMDEAYAGDSAMTALRGLKLSDVEALCASCGAEISIINGGDKLIVGGAREAVAACEQAALARGAKISRLAIHIPSHTSLMRPSVAPFLESLEGAEWRPPLAPVMRGTDGAPILQPAKARVALSAQLAQTVNWAACLDGMNEAGCAVLLELGPGDGLSRMARERLPDIPARSLSEFHTLDGAVGWVLRALEG